MSCRGIARPDLDIGARDWSLGFMVGERTKVAHRLGEIRGSQLD